MVLMFLKSSYSVLVRLSKSEGFTGKYILFRRNTQNICQTNVKRNNFFAFSED